MRDNSVAQMAKQSGLINVAYEMNGAQAAHIPFSVSKFGLPRHASQTDHQSVYPRGRVLASRSLRAVGRHARSTFDDLPADLGGGIEDGGDSRRPTYSDGLAEDVMAPIC